MRVYAVFLLKGGAIKLCAGIAKPLFAAMALADGVADCDSERAHSVGVFGFKLGAVPEMNLVGECLRTAEISMEPPVYETYYGDPDRRASQAEALRGLA